MKRYLTPQQVCDELLPDHTPARLAQLRYRGTGPEYFAPTPRKILYTEDSVRAWVEAKPRRGTADTALAG